MNLRSLHADFSDEFDEAIYSQLSKTYFIMSTRARFGDQISSKPPIHAATKTCVSKTCTAQCMNELWKSH